MIQHRKSVAIVGLLLAIFAWVPLEACACLKTVQGSPVRIGFALLLGLLLGAAGVLPRTSRWAWALVSVSVVALSCMAAFVTHLDGNDGMAVWGSLVFGPVVFCAIVWVRLRRASVAATAEG